MDYHGKYKRLGEARGGDLKFVVTRKGRSPLSAAASSVLLHEQCPERTSGDAGSVSQTSST